MGPLSNTDPGFCAFLARICIDAAAEASDWIPARNFLLDENVPDARCDSYRTAGAADAHADCRTWRSRHQRYLAQWVYRTGPSTGVPRELEQADADLCPETFRFIAPGAPFLCHHRDLHLVRVEDVSFIARLSGASADRLQELAREVAENGTPAAGFAELESALRAWSKALDIRPVFATFREDVADLFGDTPGEDAPAWADRLRDRLGLAHYDPGKRGGPIPIFVFRYRVADLPRISELGRDVRALVPPTVLDGGLYDAFCPTPPDAGATQAVTGHTLDLGGNGDAPCREVLHPTIAFGARHLWRVGSVRAPVAASSLATLRGLHLLWLRERTGVADYAADTDGDLL